MQTKAVVAFLFSLFACVCVHAQVSIAWGSVKTSSRVFAMTTDTAGNIYTAGEYEGTVDFDPGPGVQLLSMPSIPGLPYIGHYLLKLSQNNTFQQVVNLPYKVLTMNLDKDGNLLLGGRFNGTIDFDHGAGTHVVTARSNKNDFVVVKLDANFNFLWAYTGGDAYTSEVTSIKTDQNNNVFAAGYFNGIVDFDPGPDTVAYTTRNSSFASFTVKLSPSGDFVWVRRLLGDDTSLSYHQMLAIDDSANVYTIGQFRGRIDFDPGPDTMQLKTQIFRESYIYKLDSNGNFAWVKQLRSEETSAYNMDIDRAGKIILCGQYWDWVTYETIAGNDSLRADSNAQSGIQSGVFMLKVDRNGDGEWLIDLGNDDIFRYPYYSPLMSLDTSGRIYLGLYFRDSIDIDPGPGVHKIVAIPDTNWAGSGDAYLACYSPDGSLAWGESFPSHTFQDISCMHIDKWNNLLMAGSFINRMDADPYAPIYNLVATDSIDYASYIVKYDLCQGPVSRTTVTSCDSFIFNGYTRTKSGTYYQSFPTSGCDSTAVIDLTINTADATVIQDSAFLMAKSPTGTYEWIDCANGMTPVHGATNWIFYPSKTGSYALRITDNGCTAVSPCYTMIGTGIDDRVAFSRLSYHPNPTTGKVYIDFGAAQNDVAIEITDVSGRVVYQTRLLSARSTTFDLEGTAGLYFVRLTTDAGHTKVFKLVKQ